MNNQINKTLSNYFKPTPKNFRKLGDSLLGISMFITGYSIFEEMKIIAITSLIIGTIGKFLTNFFTE
jgi:hypothetical protein